MKHSDGQPYQSVVSRRKDAQAMFTNRQFAAREMLYARLPKVSRFETKRGYNRRISYNEMRTRAVRA